MSALPAFGLMDAACIATTVGVYVAVKALWRRRTSFWTSPIVLAPALLLTLLALSGLPFDTYWHGAHWLTWLLGPGTIAFAVPVYSNRELIRKYPLAIGAGVASGMVVGLGSTWALGQLLQLPDVLARSLLTKFVSSPFALLATPHFGGQAELSVFFVLITGLFGMVVGRVWLQWLQVRGDVPEGAAFGAGAHGIGTARAYQVSPICGALSSLTMILSGVLMVMLSPWLGPLLGS